MIKHPVRALAIGLPFLVVSLVYWALSYDAGGSAMLAALGVATGLMGFVLASGSPRGDENT